jgi:hypothetical protein
VSFQQVKRLETSVFNVIKMYVLLCSILSLATLLCTFFFCLCNIIEGKCIFGVCDVLSVEKILLTLLSCDEQIREQKRAGVLAEKRASSSSSSAPRILVRVTLCTSFSRTNYCSIYLEANQQLMELIRMWDEDPQVLFYQLPRVPILYFLDRNQSPILDRVYFTFFRHVWLPMRS